MVQASGAWLRIGYVRIMCERVSLGSKPRRVRPPSDAFVIVAALADVWSRVLLCGLNDRMTVED